MSASWYDPDRMSMTSTNCDAIDIRCDAIDINELLRSKLLSQFYKHSDSIIPFEERKINAL